MKTSKETNRASVVLHIGTHKTGTTTIQRALQKGRFRKDVGWVYIPTPKSAKAIMRADDYDASLVRDFKSDFNRSLKLIPSGKIPVLSSEALSGSPENGYKNSDAVASMLRDATSGFSIRVIVYLRRQDDFLESMYTQIIHQGEDITFEDFLGRFNSPDALKYSRILGEFQKHMGPESVVVRSYAAACERGILQDFGEIIGSSMLSDMDVGHANPSYSIHAIKIARICNPDLNSTNKKMLRRALQNAMPKKRGESFSFFSDHGRENLLAKYERDNFKVADQFFAGNFGELFPDIRSADAQPPSELTYDQIGRFALELLAQAETPGHSTGVLAGARVALSRYPRLRALIRRLARRP